MLQLSLVSHNPCGELQLLLSPLENVDMDLGAQLKHLRQECLI